MLVIFAVGALVPAQAGEALRLRLLRGEPGGWARVRGDGAGTNQLLTLHASSNLVDWPSIAVLHGDSFEFADPASARLPRRFYRMSAAPLAPTNDWKNQIMCPYEPFALSSDTGEYWVKFAILLPDPTRVFYADAHRYRFHYDFATARLEPLLGISPADLERISFYNQGREVALGTVLFPYYPRDEYGIQFISRDPLPRELVRDLFELVRSTVIGEAGVRAFYIPTFEQAAATHAEGEFFASNGIPVSSAERWVGGDICYSSGWALGTLKFFSATNVAAAYADGRLRPQDILITDGIPAELPYVSGIITLAPTTANSHVAILARSYGVPFAYLIEESERARVLELTNREIVLQTGGPDVGSGICRVLAIAVDPPLEPAARSELLALRTSPAFEMVPKERHGAYFAAVDNLTPAEIRFFGGKAANCGLLRRVIPSNSLPAVAISFDLWDDFMAQMLATGRTLGQEISNRLAGFAYPPDVGALQIQLAAIRSLIRTATQFTASQQQAITNALAVFDRQRKIRFRSSTNVEDAESFTGAGLYDSYSGCLADDQDGDNAGPSACDPAEADERGVFRAIRRVYASFYNDNAYLERLRLGVNDNQAGMAVLVHHSTPDEMEMANGVATGTWHAAYQYFEGNLVTQLGAVSVANPDGSAIPEEVGFSATPDRAPTLRLKQNSSLVRLGECVMSWEEDYLALARLLLPVAQGYGAMFTNRPDIQLDLEYKKVQPGVLEVKQVREVPPTRTTNVPPFVLNHPVTFANWQGFYDDLWVAHQLKSRWTLQHRSVSFTKTNLAQGFYTELSIEYLNGTNIEVLAGPITSFSNYAHEAFTSSPYNPTGVARDRWTMDTPGGPAEYVLTTIFPDYSSSQQPFRLLSELVFDGLRLDVAFNQPVRNISPFEEIVYFTNVSTRLYPLRPETSKDILLEAAFNFAGEGTNISIRTSYWLPEDARGNDCRCPILRFVESRIEGFTAEPIVLRGYWSQTFNDIHANNYQQFLFEPRLEAGLPPQQLNELAAADIAQIHVNGNGGWPVLRIVGLDGTLRIFSEQEIER